MTYIQRDLDTLLHFLREDADKLDKQEEDSYYPQVARNLAGRVSEVVAVLQAQEEKIQRLQAALRADMPPTDEGACDRYLEKQKLRVADLLSRFSYTGRGDYHSFYLHASPEPDVEDMARKKTPKMQWYIHVDYMDGPRADTPSQAFSGFITELKQKIREQKGSKLEEAEYAKRVLAELEDL